MLEIIPLSGPAVIIGQTHLQQECLIRRKEKQLKLLYIAKAIYQDIHRRMNRQFQANSNTAGSAAAV